MKRDSKSVGLVTIIFIFIIIIFGCNDGNEKVEDIDEYYVKYYVTTSFEDPASDSDIKLNIYIVNEDSIFTNEIGNVGEAWEMIIGPVKEEFHAKLYVTLEKEESISINFSTGIEVSKNGGTFNSKRGQGGTSSRDFLYISHIIIG